MNDKTEIVMRLTNEAIKIAQQYARENGTGFDTAVSALIVDGKRHIDVFKKHAYKIIELLDDGATCCLYCDGFTLAFHQKHDEDCIVLLADQYVTKENGDL